MSHLSFSVCQQLVRDLGHGVVFPQLIMLTCRTLVNRVDWCVRVSDEDDDDDIHHHHCGLKDFATF